MTRNEAQASRWVWRPEHLAVIASITYTIGLGDLWYFPYLCHKHGGYVFLFPYVIMLVVLVYPLMLLQTIPSQYCSKSGVVLYGNIAPIAAGIGWSLLLLEVFARMYYGVRVSVILHYLHVAMKWTPTTNCHDLINLNYRVFSGDFGQVEASADVTNISTVNSTGVRLSDMMRLNSNWASFQATSIVSLSIVYAVIAASLMPIIYRAVKGLVLAIGIPLFVLLIIVIDIRINNCTGESLYPANNWLHIADPGAWMDAAKQALFSFGLTKTGVTSIASHNTVQRNIFRDHLILIALDTTIGLMGYTVFGCVLTSIGNVSATNVISYDANTLLIFEAYPEILCFQRGWLWAPILLVSIFLIGITSQALMVESIITNIEDWWPRLRHYRKILVLVTCLVMWLLSLILCFDPRYRLVRLFERVSSGSATLIICLIEIFVVVECCGFTRLLSMVTTTLRVNVSDALRSYLSLTCQFVTPSVVTIVAIASVYREVTALKVTNDSLCFVEVGINILIVIITCATGIYKYCTRRQSWKRLLQPTQYLLPDARLRNISKIGATNGIGGLAMFENNAMPVTAVNGSSSTINRNLEMLENNPIPVTTVNKSISASNVSLEMLENNTIPVTTVNRSISAPNGSLEMLENNPIPVTAVNESILAPNGNLEVLENNSMRIAATNRSVSVVSGSLNMFENRKRSNTADIISETTRL